MDNRLLFSLVIPPGSPLNLPSGSVVPARLATPTFYTPPVNLLSEPGLDCGGLRFGVSRGRLTAEYIVQDFESIVQAVKMGNTLQVAEFPGRWRFRTIQSAGSHRVMLGGMIARLTAAARTAEPLSAKIRAVCALFAVFLVLRTPERVLLDAVAHQHKRFPKVYRPKRQTLIQAINSGTYHDLVLQRCLSV